jgi:predicted regulator of Ras-like GTPase activity (Roadblock/LC7/MglB family)
MAIAERQISKQEEINLVLQLLLEAIPELRGALVADHEGLPIAHQLPADFDALRASAIAATIQGLGNRTVEMLKSGALTEVSVGGTEGLAFLYAAGPKCVLTVLSPKHTNVGMIHLEARESAKTIARITSIG